MPGTQRLSGWLARRVVAVRGDRRRTRGKGTPALTIPVFYRPEQSCASAESYSPSAGKPRLVVEDWLARPEIEQQIRIESFAPAGDADLYRAHGRDYVEGVTATKSYDSAASALAASDLSRNAVVTDGKYDLVLYQAGADIHVDDPLGGLLTTEQMRERDANVFRGCAESGTPVVWNLAGGYQRDANSGIAPVLALHRNTMIEYIKRATKG